MAEMNGFNNADGTSPGQYIINGEDGQVALYSMLEMSMESGSQIPTEPIEEGSFSSYNRIIEPKEGTAMLALMGDDAEIQDALNALEELKKSDKKVEFITPFDTYENLMLVSYDYRRDGHSGQNVLQVEIRLKEVREVGTQKTTTAVEEPPPVTTEAAADGSVVSEEGYGQQQTYSPSSQEEAAAESEAGSKKSILAGVFN
jgi:hypothetical protein